MLFPSSVAKCCLVCAGKDVVFHANKDGLKGQISDDLGDAEMQKLTVKWTMRNKWKVYYVLWSHLLRYHSAFVINENVFCDLLIWKYIIYNCEFSEGA